MANQNQNKNHRVRRYELPSTEAELTQDDIQSHLEYIFDNNPTSRDELDLSNYDWELQSDVSLEDIDVEQEKHKEESNVALFERRRAVEKAQLTVGEGNPLVVVGDDNVLIEGYTRYQLLQNHFNEDTALVYKGVQKTQVDQSQNETELEKAT
jgi:hypothetical protein